MRKTITKLIISSVTVILLLTGCATTGNSSESNQSIVSETTIKEQTNIKVSQPGKTTGKTAITINKNEITDTVKFYPYEMSGRKLELMAVKASDGTTRTAFNTCQACYRSGRGYYVQEGDQIELIKGGCNPVPIIKEDKTENDKEILISEGVISEALPLFENWKR